MDEMIYKSSGQSLEIKQTEEGVTTISGYAAVFGNVDSHGDIIEKGAFLQTIEEAKVRPIPLLSSHNMDGSSVVGTPVELREDSFGLFFRAEISQADSAQDIAVKVREGHLREYSVGINLREFEIINTPGVGRGRLITNAHLGEISIVPRASNPSTRTLVVKHETNEESMSEENKSEDTIKDSVETKAANSELESMKAEMAANKAEMEALKAEMNKPINLTPAAAPAVVVETKKENNMTNPMDELYNVLITKSINSSEYHSRLGLETKALSSGQSENGGVLVPEQLQQSIIVAREQINRVQSRVFRVSVNGPITLPDFDFAESLPAVGENATTTTQDIANAFGKSTLDPQDFAVIVPLSKRLERRAFTSLIPFLQRRYAEKYVNCLDQHILRGSGQNEPLGVVTLLDSNSANTVDITADVSAVTLNNMIDIEQTLDEEYRFGAVWYVSKSAMTAIKKLKATDGQPLWQRAEASAPATFLGYPIFESKALEAGTSVGESPIVFGDYAEYLLAEEESFQLEVLREHLAATRQLGLQMTAAYDGLPMQQAAFARAEIV